METVQYGTLSKISLFTLRRNSFMYYTFIINGIPDHLHFFDARILSGCNLESRSLVENCRVFVICLIILMTYSFKIKKKIKKNITNAN